MADREAQHRLDARIAELEDANPDPYISRSPKVIWLRYEDFYTKSCDYQDVWEGECTHPAGWHRVPYRIIIQDQGILFETIRRRPDLEPGTDWTPMSEAEIKDTLNQFVADRLAQLSRNPEI